MAIKKRPFNPNLLALDDGTEIGAQGLGLGSKFVGREQNRQRRAGMLGQNIAAPIQRPQGTAGPLKSRLNSGMGQGSFIGGLDPSADALFGLLQAKENAAGLSGMGFEVEPNAASVDDDFFDLPEATQRRGAGAMAGLNSVSRRIR